MTTTLLALALLCLTTGTAEAQEAKVTPLMSRDLAENPGREVLMITVEYPPGAAYPPTQCSRAGLRPGGLRSDAGQGWQTGHPDTRADLL